MLPFPVLSGATVIMVAVAATSLWLMHKSVGLFAFRQVTIPSFAYLVYFLAIFLPALRIYEDGIEPYRWRFLFSVASALITIPLGILFVSWILGFEKKEIASHFESPLVAEPFDGATTRAFLIFLSFACGVALLHASQVETMPILYLIRNPGDLWQAALMREDSFKLLNSQFTYLFYVVRGTLFPFLVLLSFGHFLQEKKLMRFLLFAGTLAAAVAYAVMTIEKAPVAILILLLFLFYYVFKRGHLQKRLLLLGLILFVSFPAAIIALIYHGRDTAALGSVLTQIWDRIFRTPAEVLYSYFEVFPDIIPYQHGASIGRLSAIMGWNTIDIPNAVGHYMLGNGADVLASVSANACFLGNWNADFGLTGVLVGGLLAGASLQTTQIIVMRRRKTVSNLAIYSFLMVAFGFLVSVPLPFVLLSGGVVFIFLASALLECCRRALLPGTPSIRIPTGTSTVGDT
jgi:oligosaccharide repeat unit polymerase